MDFDDEKCCLFEFPEENNAFSHGFESFIINRKDVLEISGTIYKVKWPKCNIRPAKYMPAAVKGVEYEICAARILLMGDYNAMSKAANNKSKYGTFTAPVTGRGSSRKCEDEAEAVVDKEVKKMVINRTTKKKIKYEQRKQILEEIQFAKPLMGTEPTEKVLTTNLPTENRPMLEGSQKTAEKDVQGEKEAIEVQGTKNVKVPQWKQVEHVQEKEVTHVQGDKKEVEQGVHKVEKGVDKLQGGKEVEQGVHGSKEQEVHDQKEELEVHDQKEEQEVHDQKEEQEVHDQKEEVHDQKGEQEVHDQNEEQEVHDRKEAEQEVQGEKEKEVVDTDEEDEMYCDSLEQDKPLSLHKTKRFYEDSDSESIDYHSKKSKPELITKVETLELEVKHLKKELRHSQNMLRLVQGVPQLLEACNGAIEKLKEQSGVRGRDGHKTSAKRTINLSTPNWPNSKSPSYNIPIHTAKKNPSLSPSSLIPSKRLQSFLMSSPPEGRPTSAPPMSSAATAPATIPMEESDESSKERISLLEIVPQHKLFKCNNKKPTLLVCDLLSVVFDATTLRNSSLTGTKANTSGPLVEKKRKLDQVKVAAIIDYTMELFPGHHDSNEKRLLSAIRVKLNNMSCASKSGSKKQTEEIQ